ncbi:hypothetical protein BGW36DRAFT_429068 [Talaromyces proteolyticus]|uniref:F-box domain-containing protein n=1 Tax=Talaromyces proteolyticus TaxID=1131652 RepID=A0AAD4PWK5_9EURO|nr:uncharacterized protein BGW36DRAFT_429068 [Talaromyces proteolyticus]KAH8695185.1 hypothetical protein BGW36DRAFT_429068 [Talaromyces proteolyticus]
MAAGQTGDNHIEDGDDARDDGLQDCADAVDDGHQAGTDCAEDGFDLYNHEKRRNLGGRPPLSFAELEARKVARRTKRRWKEPEDDTQKQRRQGTSLLEQLPVELIEKIFLYALETNLCHASPYLAAAVSSERIYRALIRLAFWDEGQNQNQNQNQNAATSGRLLPLRNADSRKFLADALKPADYDQMRMDDAERTHLQATILKCKWCTMARIQAQLPALMQMAIHRFWTGPGITMEPAEKASLHNFLHRKGDSKVFQGLSHKENTYYMSVIPLVSVSINCAEEYVRHVHRVLRLRVIPDRLLRGSSRESESNRGNFSDETINLLELFRHAYGFDGTGHDVSFSRDALQTGIQNALQAQNTRALTTLLKIDEFFARRRLETGPLSTYPSSQQSAQQQYYAIPANHFILTVQLPVPNTEIITLFKLLLRCNAESVPADSPEVTQWAMGLAEGSGGDANVAFGRWILDFMVELPRHIDVARSRPREEALFYYGALNAESGAGRMFIEEGCAGEVDPDAWRKPWIQSMSFDVSQTWLPVDTE